MLDSTVETIRIKMIVLSIILLMLTILWAIGLLEVGPVIAH